MRMSSGRGDIAGVGGVKVVELHDVRWTLLAEIDLDLGQRA